MERQISSLQMSSWKFSCSSQNTKVIGKNMELLILHCHGYFLSNGSLGPTTSKIINLYAWIEFALEEDYLVYKNCAGSFIVAHQMLEISEKICNYANWTFSLIFAQSFSWGHNFECYWSTSIKYLVMERQILVYEYSFGRFYVAHKIPKL